MRIERHQFAIEHCIRFHLFKGLGNWRIAVADDLAVAGVELDVSAFDLGHHAKAIPLGLENPSRVVERRIGQRCKHRLQPLGKLGDTWHWFTA